MKGYQFSTHKTIDNKRVIPEGYIQKIPVENRDQVIVLGNEMDLPFQNQANELPSLKNVIAQIKLSPPDQALIQPASGLLAEHLSNCPENPYPTFDVEKWNQEWDDLEAKMKADVSS
ncbi:MAG: hypothetical protein VSS75_025795 [Candidatus Parabeggiatoa sp.]|nr:hypothetical protein [Candidatus Parabeggiatoa sp.]